MFDPICVPVDRILKFSAVFGTVSLKSSKKTVPAGTPSMVISKKNEFIRIALIATIFSVLGALFGYYIGNSLNEVATKIFEFYGYEYSDSFKERFTVGGGFFTWLGILVTAGFTPLPFKLLTISSGIIHFNLISFIFICIVTRGLRFFLVAYLTYKFGQKIGPFLDKQGTKWSIIIALAIILIVTGVYFLFLN